MLLKWVVLAFPDTDTRAAWRVGRYENVIEVALAIVLTAIDDLLAEPRDSSEAGAPMPEVWALDCNGIPILLLGMAVASDGLPTCVG